MSPQDLIYSQAFKQFLSLGHSQRDAEPVAAEAVRLWRRNTKAADAISKAIANGKKICGKPT